MKKTLLLLASAAMLLVGCAKETLSPEAGDGEMVNMTVTASVQGEELTKAVIDNDGMGVHADRCIMVLYYGDKVYGRYVATVSGYHATFDVKVPAKRTYKAVFWADCATEDGGDLYYNTADLKNIKLKSAYVGNNDKRDAFFKCKEYTVENKSQSFTAELTRPFSQINVISTDIQALKLAELYPQKVNLSFSAATSFNAMSGECGDAEAIIYEADVYKAYDPAKTQLTLSMDYLFASTEQGAVDIEFKAPTEGELKVEYSFTNIPYQRNYRTNIIGNLLTADAHWDVTINPEWNTPEYFEELWAAGMITPVTPVDDVYTINRPSELAWIAQQVNAGNTFTGKTVKLAKDIDLNNGAWTPAGGVSSYPSTAFCGTFDGQNYKILNLNCSDKTKQYASAALFGAVKGGIIKNVTIENVKVSSTHYAAALVGYVADGIVTISNCGVKNGTITSIPEWLGTEYDNGDKVGGLLGYGANACAISGCIVDGLEIKAYRDLGGIAGAVKCAEIKNNMVKNCTITADQTVNFYGKKDYNAGAIVGRSFEGTVDESNTAENVVVKTLGNAAEKALSEATDGSTVTLKDVDSGNTVNIPAGFAKNVTIASDATDKSGVSRFEIPAGAKIENLTIKDFEPALQAGSSNSFVHIPADASFSMTVKDVKAAGDGVKNNWNTLVRVEPCDNSELASEIVIDGVEINAAKYLVYSSGGSRAISLTVKNCNIKNLTSWMVMANGSQFKNVTIDNCTIENCSGIVKFVMDSFTFTNNTLLGDNKEDHSASKKCIDYRGSNPTMTVSGNTSNGVNCDDAILAKTF